MNDMVSVALAGICGYGHNYVPYILNLAREHKTRFVGVIEPFIEKSKQHEYLQAEKVPIYQSLEQFYKREHADVVILVTPIHLHCQQSHLAMTNGSHVLCEKPLAATIQDAISISEHSYNSKKLVSIGYQRCFSQAIQSLRRDFERGLFGRAKRLKALVLWPRGKEYYARNRWAGRIKSDDGDWVLDSPIHNATAHYLHELFFILGSRIDNDRRPRDVIAELYRAHEIENFDTAALRCHTADNIEILFYASHAVPEYKGPIVHCEFENAVIQYETNGYGDEKPHIIAHFTDGTAVDYGSPDDNPYAKVDNIIGAVRTEMPVLCNADDAIPQVLCINGAQESAKSIVNFPTSLIDSKLTLDGTIPCVQNLTATLLECYEKNVLPSELGVLWAKPGLAITLTHYRNYPITR